MTSSFLTRTVHLPVSADGSSIRNAFGVEIAKATNAVVAEAMAEIINMAETLATAADQKAAQTDARIRRMFDRAANRKAPVL